MLKVEALAAPYGIDGSPHSLAAGGRRCRFLHGCFARTHTYGADLRIGHKGEPIDGDTLVLCEHPERGLLMFATIDDPVIERRLRSMTIHGLSVSCENGGGALETPWDFGVRRVRRINHVAIVTGDERPAFPDTTFKMREVSPPRRNRATVPVDLSRLRSQAPGSRFMVF